MSKTKDWYEGCGFLLINNWLTEMAAKGYGKVYIENFSFIPAGINKGELQDMFNRDAGKGAWELVVESNDSDETEIPESSVLVCVNNKICKK